jgi:hypothetical protein
VSTLQDLERDASACPPEHGKTCWRRRGSGLAGEDARALAIHDDLIATAPQEDAQATAEPVTARVEILSEKTGVPDPQRAPSAPQTPAAGRRSWFRSAPARPSQCWGGDRKPAQQPWRDVDPLNRLSAVPGPGMSRSRVSNADMLGMFCARSLAR